MYGQKENLRYLGIILAEPDGYMIVRYRRIIIVYCPCGKGIVGEFPQRTSRHRKARLQNVCFFCWHDVPRTAIIDILKDRGFAGVSL